MEAPTPAPHQAAATTTTKSLKAPNAKQYIIAGLMAILAAAVIVTVFFIVLSPARIVFSVVNASSHKTTGGEDVELALTLSVNNTSTSARVKYSSFYIDVSNSTSTAGFWYRANSTTAVAMLSLLQPKLNVTRIDATLSFHLEGSPWDSYFTGNMTSNAFAVMVTAVVRFKVGIAQTRQYDIKVACAPVSFFRDAAKVAGVPPAPLPVLCG